MVVSPREKEVDTTMRIPWSDLTGQLTVTAAVYNALGHDQISLYDTAGLEDAYRAAVDEALPDGVLLAGDTVVCGEETSRSGIAAAVRAVGIAEMAGHYRLWDRGDVSLLLYGTRDRKQSAGTRMSAWGVKACLYRAADHDMRPRAYYRKGEVEAAYRAAPGKGNWGRGSASG